MTTLTIRCKGCSKTAIGDWENLAETGWKENLTAHGAAYFCGECNKRFEAPTAPSMGPFNLEAYLASETGE